MKGELNEAQYFALLELATDFARSNDRRLCQTRESVDFHVLHYLMSTYQNGNYYFDKVAIFKEMRSVGFEESRVEAVINDIENDVVFCRVCNSLKAISENRISNVNLASDSFVNKVNVYKGGNSEKIR